MSAGEGDELPDGYLERPVWTHDKGRERMLAGLRKYKGSPFFDIRAWVHDGVTPTCKGASIPLDQVGALAAAMAEWAARRDTAR